MIKKYRLLKDLPGVKAGVIFELYENGKYKYDESVDSRQNEYTRFFDFYEYEMEKIPEFFEPIKERWEPKEGERFFHFDKNICSSFLPISFNCSEIYFENGNCFKTREKAEEAVKRVRETLDKYHEEIGE